MSKSNRLAALYNTMFRDVQEFRKAFDLPCTGRGTTIPERVLHTSLFVEELTELAEATSLVEQADALVDICYVLVGKVVHEGHYLASDSNLVSRFITVADRLNIPFEECWAEIHRSNMTKLVKDEQDETDTLEQYGWKGIKVTLARDSYPSPVVCTEDVEYQGTMILKGKTLKAYSYEPARLSPILEAHLKKLTED